MERMYQGAMNSGRALVLHGGLDWKPMSLSPADMDFVEQKRQAARDIALAFGVPPVLVGLPGDATYANAREAVGYRPRGLACSLRERERP
jgi:HK97 family phage portal protein